MNRLVVLLSITAFSLIALAKDGPFPVASAVGTWHSENVKGYSITLFTGARSESAIEVGVLVENNEGRRLALGQTTHPYHDSTLKMTLYDIKGGREKIEIKAVPAKDLHEPVGSGYHLIMTIEKVGNPSRESSLVFGRH